MNEAIHLSISGMSCAGCVAAVEDALRRVPGVDKVSVSLVEQGATVEGSVAVSELLEAVSQAGYEAEELRDAADNRYRRLAKQSVVAILIGVSLMVVNMSEQFGLGRLIPPMSNIEGQVFWLLAGLVSLMVMVYSGGQYFRGAWKSIRKRNINQDILIALGTGIAWVYSMAVAGFPQWFPALEQHRYFDATIILIALNNIALIFEIRVSGKVSRHNESTRQASMSRPPIAHLADRLAMVLVPSVLIIAVLNFLAWYIFAPTGNHFVLAIVTTLSVLFIVSPSALALAPSISLMSGADNAEARGVRINNGEILQQVGRLTTVVLDKSGTVTEGHPLVVEVIPADGFSEEEILTYSLSAECSSQHPLARAIVDHARAKGSRKKLVSAYQLVPGQGIEAVVEGEVVRVGNTRLMMEKGIDGGWLGRKAAELSQLGQTPMFISVGKEIAGLISVSDAINMDSAAAVQRMQRAGLKVVLLSGDNAITTDVVAKQLGVDEVVADVLPMEKATVVQELKDRGEVVAMVGGGVSDASALANADIGFATSGDADISLQGSLHGIMDAIEVSAATVRNIKQNLFGAFIYNSLAIPIAAGILVPRLGGLGILNPMIAGSIMLIFTLLVMGNANRLRWFKLRN